MFLTQGLATILLAFASHAEPHASQTKRCGAILSEKTSHTVNLIAYLSSLLESGVLRDEDFARWFGLLEKGELTNPITEDLAQLKSAFTIHREGIENILEQKGLDISLLKSWAGDLLRARGVTKNDKAKTQIDTRDSSLPIDFHPIPAGSARIATQNSKIEATFTNSIEVMETPVTQMQWVKLFKENPSVHVEGPHTHLFEVDGRKIKLQPDNPVENITWWSAVVAANKLSVDRGLPPSYDLSGIKWVPGTRAEDGSLQAESGEIKINAPEGDIYRASGIRLPTEGELAYLSALEIRANGTTNLYDRYWHDNNSGGTTHPVTEHPPFVLNSQPIFDIFGSVGEWCQDWSSYRLTHGPVNPKTERKAQMRMLRGSNYNLSFKTQGPEKDQISSNLYHQDPNERAGSFGVRFVRTLAK